MTDRGEVPRHDPEQQLDQTTLGPPTRLANMSVVLEEPTNPRPGTAPQCGFASAMVALRFEAQQQALFT
jgi:hypothetical protein